MAIQDIINNAVTDTSQYTPVAPVRFDSQSSSQPTTAPVYTPTVTPANTISSTELTASPTVTEAEPSDPIASYRSFIAGFAPDTTDLDTQRQNLSEEKTGLLRDSSRADRFSELDAKYGYSSAVSEVAELDEEIARLKADFDAAITDEEGRTIAGRFITGRQAQILKQKAVAVGAKSAIREALQGKVTAAEGIIEDTITREFEDRDDEIKALEFELQENADALEARTGKSEKELALILQERSRVLAEEKAERTEAMNLAKEAIQGGAPANIATKMAQAKTAQEALAIGGQYIGAMDRQLKSLQIQKAQAELNNILSNPEATEEQKAEAASATQKIETLTEVMGVIQNLNTMAGKDGALGKSQKIFASSWFAPEDEATGLIPNTAANSFALEVNRLNSLLSYENLDKLKGAMSDKDLLFLKSIGTSLSTSQTKEAFDKELLRITNSAADGLKEANNTLGISSAGSVNDYLDEIDTALNSSNVYATYADSL